MKKTLYVHETHIMPDSLMPFIFHTDRICERRIVPNWHENIELLCFIEGEGRLKCGGELYSVRAGDVAVINPNTLHVTEGELVYHCLIIDKSFCDSNGIPVLSLHFEEIIKSGELYEAFVAAAEAIRAAREGGDALTSVLRARHAVLFLLCELCEKHMLSEPPESRARVAASERVKSVMTYIRENFARPVTLDGIADTLAGDALVFGDLGQREIVVVVIINHIPLFLGQHIAVKVQQ